MKRAAGLSLLVLCFLSPAAASAQTFNDQGVLSLEFHLRASLRDEILICSDHDFTGSAEAYTFANALVPALGFGHGSAIYKRVDFKDCVRVFPDRPLTRAGPRAHERSFHFDPGPVAAAMGRFQLEFLGVDVCAPELPTHVQPITGLDRFGGGTCDHPFQQSYSYFTNEDGTNPVIDVSFRATPSSLLRGLLGLAAFWALVAGLLTLLACWLKRTSWRFFDGKRALIAWLLDIVLTFTLIFLAAAVAPYWTGWIPSLELYLRIPTVVEWVLVATPGFGLAVVMLGGPLRRKALRGARGPQPAHTFPSPSARAPSLAVPDWWGAPRADVDTPSVGPLYEIGPTGKAIPPVDSVRFLFWPRWGVLHPWRFSFVLGMFEGVFAAGFARYLVRLHPTASSAVGVVFGVLYFVMGPIQVARWTPAKEERTRHRLARMPRALNILRWPLWAAVLLGGLVGVSFLGQAIRAVTQGRVLEGLWILQLASAFPLLIVVPAISRHTRGRDRRAGGHT